MGYLARKDPGLSTIRIKVDLDVVGPTDAEVQDGINYVAKWSPILKTLKTAQPIAIEKAQSNHDQRYSCAASDR